MGPSLPGWLLVVLVASLEACQAPAGSSAVLPTPEWGSPGPLLLRAAASRSALLLRKEGASVYRYEPSSKELTTAPVSTWEQGGEIIACERQRPASELSLNATTGEARLEASRVRLTGSFAYGAVKSPTGSRAVVSSAAGKGSSLMPFIANGLRAPFSYDVLVLPGGQPAGPAGKLAFGSRTSWVLACWSPDERFLVFTDLVMSALTIVSVGPPLP